MASPTMTYTATGMPSGVELSVAYPPPAGRMILPLCTVWAKPSMRKPAPMVRITALTFQAPMSAP